MKKSKVQPGPACDGLKSNRGQALIEYVLILIITVSLVLTLMNFIFKPFGEFISQYMGQYTACLLEYGELPSIGSEEPSLVDEEGECNARFESGTIAAGRPPRNNPSGGGTTPTNNSNDSQSSGSQGRGSGAGGSASRGERMGKRSTGVESSPVAAGANKRIEIALDTGPGGRFFNSNSDRENVMRRADKTTYVAITGLTEAERKQLANKEGKGKAIATGQGVTPPVKKLLVKKPPQRALASEEEDGWSIGNFIRYLFIGGLIIALIVFIGGQALQLSKNFEK